MEAIAMSLALKFLPLFSPLIVAALKKGLAVVSAKADLPNWSKPILSAVIGGVIAYLTGDTAAAAEAGGEAALVLSGAIEGLAGSKARDIIMGKNKAEK